MWGTDLSVVRNGVVIGVQEGPATPDLSWSLDQRLRSVGDLPTSPFPVTTRVTRTLASCDQYPSGQGSPYLAPGSYTLVVTQTLSYTPTPTPYGYTDIPASPVLTPVPGRTVAHDLVDVADPVVVAIQGGTVVARSVVPNHPDAWTGGLTATFPDPPALTRCPGVPAPTDGGPGLPGDYALRLVVDVTVTGAEPGTWLIASAPLP